MENRLLIYMCLALIFIGLSYGAYALYFSDKPEISTNTIKPLKTISKAPVFSLNDVNGTDGSLGAYYGDVIALHFMAVGCGGQYARLNDNQLRQLKLVCDSKCKEGDFHIITVLVSSCENSDLNEIKGHYNVTWLFGNDYDDGRLEIIERFKNYNLEDGQILLINPSFEVTHISQGEVTAGDILTVLNHLQEG
jgi:hypothetical protein